MSADIGTTSSNPSPSGTTQTFHATTIALGPAAAMIVGVSGAGKSDLALRCLATPQGQLIAETPLLVADDQTCLALEGGNIVVTAPPSIRGHLEVRGLGIFPLPTCHKARLALVVELSDERPERLPETPLQTCNILGRPISKLLLQPFEASSPLKLLMALAAHRRFTHPSQP
jgi:HPr kinase/phosphorylase